MPNSTERIALFIDGANLYAAARSLGFDIDYKRLLDLFGERGKLIRAYYYTVLIEDQDYSPIRPLVDWLDYNGFTLITKPAKEFSDQTGRRRIRNSTDVELAIDMLELAPHLDHILLFSGDGGFRRAVEAVQRLGVRVTLVSTTRSNPPMAADELRRQADDFIELRDLADDIKRARSPSRPAPDSIPVPVEEYDDDDYDDDEYDEFEDGEEPEEQEEREAEQEEAEAGS